MKIIAIIPARYNSSRLKGKPLMDICSRPMIWWVYNQVVKTSRIQEVYVATDSVEIKRVCDEYKISCIMTSKEHNTSTQRLNEVAQNIKSDVYICVNGDEPLIDPNLIEKIIPNDLNNFFVSNLMTKISNPVEAIDESNIKVVTDAEGNALFMSRSVIPHPKSSIDFDYYKHLGVLAYSLEALSFFANTPKGKLEKIEDINELRFIENGKKLKMIEVNANTLSVDTQKDLDYVRKIIKDKIKRGEIKI